MGKSIYNIIHPDDQLDFSNELASLIERSTTAVGDGSANRNISFACRLQIKSGMIIFCASLPENYICLHASWNIHKWISLTSELYHVKVSSGDDFSHISLCKKSVYMLYVLCFKSDWCKCYNLYSFWHVLSLNCKLYIIMLNFSFCKCDFFFSLCCVFCAAFEAE